MELQNKTILLISPFFFGYDKDICQELEFQGAKVIKYVDRPSEDVFTKVLVRLSPKVLSRKIHNYYSKIIEENSSLKIDYILFIKCESALPQDLIRIKEVFNDAEMYLYLWDSISQIKYFDEKVKCFDRVYSFDDIDVTNVPLINFLPLFYCPTYYKKTNETNSDVSFDIAFIGSMHSDRAKIVYEIMNICKKNNKSFYFKLYIPNRLLFLYYYITKKEFRYINRTGEIICSDKISKEEMFEVYNNSKCVLDINYPNQRGLTMRTIELLGMNKKIMTTNARITKYDFFKKDMVSVIDRKDIKIDFLFIEKSKEGFENREKYSIQNWCKNIFAYKKGDF